jgi:hypothetical protein
MSRRKATRKDVEQLLRAAEAADWRVVSTARHFACYAPDGVTIVTVPQTPSDARSIKNCRSLLRRAGVPV